MNLESIYSSENINTSNTQNKKKMNLETDLDLRSTLLSLRGLHQELIIHDSVASSPTTYCKDHAPATYSVLDLIVEKQIHKYKNSPLMHLYFNVNIITIHKHL